MKRTTIHLDAELKRRLQRAAARSGASEASLIREALREFLCRAEGPGLQPVGRSTDGGVAWRDERALGDLGFGRE